MLGHISLKVPASTYGGATSRFKPSAKQSQAYMQANFCGKEHDSALCTGGWIDQTGGLTESCRAMLQHICMARSAAREDPRN